MPKKPCFQRPHASMLSRDQRIQVQTLHEFGHRRYSDIASDVGCTINQVHYAATHRITPQKHHCGRHLLLSEEEIDVLVDFVCLSRKNRRMPWLEIAMIWGCSEKAIGNAFKSRGFSRRIAQKRPVISEKNRVLRLQWAIEHLDWTVE